MAEVAAGFIVDRIREKCREEVLYFEASQLVASVGWDLFNTLLSLMIKHDIHAVADGTEQLGQNPIFVIWTVDDDKNYRTIALYSFGLPEEITDWSSLRRELVMQMRGEAEERQSFEKTHIAILLLFLEIHCRFRKMLALSLTKLYNFHSESYLILTAVA